MAADAAGDQQIELAVDQFSQPGRLQHLETDLRVRTAKRRQVETAGVTVESKFAFAVFTAAFCCASKGPRSMSGTEAML